MAYAQWVTITLKPLNFTLGLADVKLACGKFHAYGDKDQEISIDVIQNTSVNKGQEAIICSCGRESAAMGTEGSFDIINRDRNVTIGNVYWECPWGSKKNTFRWTPNFAVVNKYMTQVTGANLDSGALGNVTITLLDLSAPWSRQDEPLETAGSQTHADGGDGTISVVRRTLVDELQRTVDALENGFAELSAESRR